jgi:hypothetical protein
MSQHAELSAERWRQFTVAQQILMIANEMHRGLSAMQPERNRSLRLGYERVLRLVDLTVETRPRQALRRELLLWRGVIAELYLRDESDRDTHVLALKVLLQMTPEAAKQVAGLGL